MHRSDDAIEAENVEMNLLTFNIHYTAQQTFLRGAAKFLSITLHS